MIFRLKKCLSYSAGSFIGEKIGKPEGSKGCIPAPGGNVTTTQVIPIGTSSGCGGV